MMKKDICWYWRSTAVIDKILSKLPASASKSVIESTIGKAYPFDTYKKEAQDGWKEAKRKLLQIYFPHLFAAPKKKPKKKVAGQLVLFESVEV